MKIYGYEHLAMSNEELRMHCAKRVLKGPFRRYIEKFRFRKLQIRMAIKI